MIKNLQSLRFVFSFSIFVSHLMGHELSTFGLGEYGVVGFFILSGFVLSVAYGPKIEDGRFKTWPFFCKQWAKLYPLHLATFLLAIVYEAHYGNFFSWKQLLPPVFLLQSWIPDETFHYIPNGSSWSLCGFFFFYLVFGALWTIVHRLSWRSLLGGAICVLAAYLLVALSTPERLVYPFVYTSPLMRLPDFMLGIVLHRLLISESGRRFQERLAGCKAWLLSLMEAVILLLPAAAFLIYGATNHAVRCVSLFWPFVALQLLLFSWGDGLRGAVTRVFHSRAVMFLGSISFEIYLVHMFIVPSARHAAFLLGFEPVGPVSLALAFTATVPLAYAAKRCLTTPVFNFLKPYLQPTS